MSHGSAPRFDQVRTWLFDMDNTLYHPRANLFAQIDRKMEAYVARLLGCGTEEARRVQKAYFHEHGTTLRGLMNSHGVQPRHFLDFVHDIDFSVLEPDSALADGLRRLPGRKLVFTNGDTPYAEKVLGRLGILDCFEAIFDIEAMDYLPKPDPTAYRLICDRHAFDPATALFAEDMAHNLRPAKALGMATLWVNNGSERGNHGAHPDFIDVETDGLSQWISDYTTENTQ